MLGAILRDPKFGPKPVKITGEFIIGGSEQNGLRGGSFDIPSFMALSGAISQLAIYLDTMALEVVRLRDLFESLINGKVLFKADSDAVLVKGIVALLVEAYSGLTPEEITAQDTGFLKEIGITEHLSMNRTNGLANMVKQIKMYAMAFQSLVAKGINNVPTL